MSTISIIVAKKVENEKRKPSVGKFIINCTKKKLNAPGIWDTITQTRIYSVWYWNFRLASRTILIHEQEAGIRKLISSKLLKNGFTFQPVNPLKGAVTAKTYKLAAMNWFV